MIQETVEGLANSPLLAEQFPIQFAEVKAEQVEPATKCYWSR